MTPGLSRSARRGRRKSCPPTSAGRRCLDVGTFDGFWAFEMERRGASEVIATDVGSPADVQHTPHNRERALAWQAEQGIEHGTGFEIAKDLLGSERRARRLQRLRPLAGDDRRHRSTSRSSARCCSTCATRSRRSQNLRSVLVPGGEAVLMDNIDVPLTLLRPRTPVAHLRAPRPENMWTWWIPNLAVAARLGPHGRPRADRPPPGADPARPQGLRGVFAAIRVRRPLD